MKTAKENLLDTLKGKKILFLENDNGLYHGLDRLEEFLKQNKLKYKCLFDLSNQPLLKVEKAVAKADVVVFQTQWLYPVSRTMLEYFTNVLSDKKTIVECRLGDPTWYYKPKSKADHDVYVLKPPYEFEDQEKWSFYKLSDKPYWDYKNKFDV